MSNSTICVGVDLGFGNFKLVGGEVGASASAPARIVMPVGAAPIEFAPKRLDGKADARDGEVVNVAGQEWVAGVDPVILQGFARQTHADYPMTKEYLALFYAGLARLGLSHIDVLVTGLPCSQYFEGKEYCDRLAQRLKGGQNGHWINGKLRVTIGRVGVMAQPTGAFLSLAGRDRTIADSTDASVLVIDVGYYSTDWVLMVGGSMKDHSSGSSMLATSTVLDEARKLISQDNDGMPISSGRIEATYRRGQKTLQLGDREVPLAHYMEAAAASLSPQLMAAILTSLRREQDVVDTVMLTGGGAPLFAQAAKTALKLKRDPIIDRDPVISNANGFFIAAGRSAAKALAQTA